MNFLHFLAASTTQEDKIDPKPLGIPIVKDANAAMTGLLNTVYTWAGVICVVIIIIGGFYYVTSSGNPSATKRAKDIILGAVIGLVVVIMAFVITQFVIGRF